MELTSEKGSTVTRLVICLALAWGLYFGGNWLCTHQDIPLWERYHPWLEENKVQAIAVMAAVLFGVSLLLCPLEGEELDCPSEDIFEPCEPI